MRRQFITHPSFQYSFTFWFVAGVAVLFVLIGLVTLGPVYLLSTAPELSVSQQGFFHAYTHEFFWFLFYLFVFSVLVFTWVGLYLSYKFVGPLARLEAWLTDCLSSKTARSIKLRPGDEMIGIASVLTEILENRFRKSK